ncbi:hypothetical protein SAICODRAFT_20393 [Saitoella complicata NRRL Y-17804]|uniref:Zn(2)-C6 fungal-type domain-containing protein n=1 Tax=Saitoella complicata (strain BCRC 22490 / CBS 7301 / JCM 7358 / NBRC 10748 / NRRL Y-17804) TaxID=698492 RepID=A0A0E9NLU1_SAICN|nr:uncharacterized protein SAICODRAFT_20393 [Saitoella complicata NRRL Y-17804]ODQ51731.1 hypothetical protein SAICODRAFT_20393 [Saitoella complicata NRRL Y-17804]GAO50651.1 hypothetical protein G7K_4774-t1 [Saitoella complicata NRRL Y-17804]
MPPRLEDGCESNVHMAGAAGLDPHTTHDSTVAIENTVPHGHRLGTGTGQVSSATTGLTGTCIYSLESPALSTSNSSRADGHFVNTMGDIAYATNAPTRDRKSGSQPSRTSTSATTTTTTTVIAMNETSDASTSAHTVPPTTTDEQGFDGNDFVHQDNPDNATPRRRNNTACFRCRRRKIRCSFADPANANNPNINETRCFNCLTGNHICSFADRPTGQPRRRSSNGNSRQDPPGGTSNNNYHGHHGTSNSSTGNGSGSGTTTYNNGAIGTVWQAVPALPPRASSQQDPNYTSPTSPTFSNYTHTHTNSTSWHPISATPHGNTFWTRPLGRTTSTPGPPNTGVFAGNTTTTPRPSSYPEARHQHRRRTSSFRGLNNSTSSRPRSPPKTKPSAGPISVTTTSSIPVAQPVMSSPTTTMSSIPGPGPMPGAWWTPPNPSTMPPEMLGTTDLDALTGMRLVSITSHLAQTTAMGNVAPGLSSWGGFCQGQAPAMVEHGTTNPTMTAGGHCQGTPQDPSSGKVTERPMLGHRRGSGFGSRRATMPADGYTTSGSGSNTATYGQGQGQGSGAGVGVGIATSTGWQYYPQGHPYGPTPATGQHVYNIPTSTQHPSAPSPYNHTMSESSNSYSSLQTTPSVGNTQTQPVFASHMESQDSDLDGDSRAHLDELGRPEELDMLAHGNGWIMRST